MYCASILLALAAATFAAPLAPVSDAQKRDFCIEFNTQDCRNFELYSIPSDAVDQYFTIGTAANVPIPANLPQYLQGLFYMEGNPLSDEVISLAGGKWVDSEQAYYLRVYDAGIWSWDDSFTGHLLYDAVRLAALTYRLTFDSAGVAFVEPLFYLPPYLLNANIAVTQSYANFTIIPTADPNAFIRRSSFLGQSTADYQFIKIVDGNGQRTEKWDSVYIPRIGAGALTNAPAGFSNSTHLGTTQLLARVA